MKKILRKLKRFLDPFFQKYFDTFIWKFRHYIRSDWREGYIDTSSLEHPHRQLIVDAVRNKFPARNILELGSGSGINLLNLRKHFPEIEYKGIDINRKAISLGKKELQDNNIRNIELEVGNISDIKRMKSNSIDVILTDAVLMYVHPKEMQMLFTEMFRVSRLGMVLCEQMSPGGVYNDHWRHDYNEMFQNLLGAGKLNATKITSEYWDADWVKFGYLITIEKFDLISKQKFS